MMKMFLLAFIITCMACIVNAELSDDAWAHYSLTDMGNSVDGQYNFSNGNMTELNATDCVIGKCFQMTDSSSYLVTTTGLPQDEHVTINFWMYYNSDCNDKRFFGRQESDAGDWAYSSYFGSYEFCSFRYATDRVGGSNSLLSDNPLTTNTWHMLTFIQNGSQKLIFIDGVLNKSIDYDYNVSYVTDSPIYFGDTGYGNTIESGRFDEITLWSRGLTVEEVSDLYAFESTGTGYPYVITPSNDSAFYECEYTNDGMTYSLINDSIGINPLIPDAYVYVHEGIIGDGCHLNNSIYGGDAECSIASNITDITICQWFNSTGTTALAGTLAYNNCIDNASDNTIFYDFVNDAFKYNQYQYNPSGEARATFPVAHKLYGWHQVCQVNDYSDKDIDLYLDGVSLGTVHNDALIQMLDTNTCYVFHAFENLTSTVYMNTTLDDVYYFDGELSSGDITSLFNSYNHTICYEDWIAQYTACINDSQIKSYYDDNDCGTSYEFPADNDTVIDCGVPDVAEVVSNVNNALINLMIVAIILIIPLGFAFVYSESDIVKIVLIIGLAVVGLIAFIVALSLLNVI